MTDPFLRPEHQQGSPEWLAHRQSHIGASDASIILGENPWTTPLQLWEQKLGLAPPPEMNAAMQRGIDMEPEARAAFERSYGLEMYPRVIYHDDHGVLMASMDGMTLDGSCAVEIKCPGKKAHSTALSGEVPGYYRAQCQHQLACSGLDSMWYYSYDGQDGIGIEVERDDEYIANMIEKELAFWEFVVTRTSPPSTDRDYIKRDCPVWSAFGLRLQEIAEQESALKKEKENIRKTLIEFSGDHSSKGGGITLTKSLRRGTVKYDGIPELDGVDLEPYRSPSKEVWTLNINRS